MSLTPALPDAVEATYAYEAGPDGTAVLMEHRPDFSAHPELPLPPSRSRAVEVQMTSTVSRHGSGAASGPVEVFGSQITVS